MKTLALFSALGLVALTLSANAQGPAQPWRPVSTTLPGEPVGNAPVVLHPYQAQLLQKGKAVGAQFKTTATASRLISRSELKPVNFVLTYVDSSVYAFSGGRGSDLESDNAQYDSYLQYKYNNGSAQFVNDQRGTITYNAANKMTDNLTEHWDIPTQIWKNFWHNSYVYDAQNNLVTRVQRKWDLNTAAWKNLDHLSYTYNGQGQLATYTRQTWDANTAAWKNYSQELFTYAGTLLETEVEKMWDANTAAWKNYRRTEYTYDAGNRILKEKQFSWDANAAAWKNSYQAVYTYTPAGYLETFQQMNWDAQANIFQGVTLDTYTYTATGKRATASGQQRSNNVWVNSYRVFYTYDAQDRETVRVQEQWVTSTNSWKTVLGQNTAYHPDNTTAEIIYKDADANNVLQNDRRELMEYNSWKQLTRKQEQTWAANNWITLPADSRYNYGYEDYQATGIAQPGHLDADVHIFPNPATEHIRITAQFAKPQAASVFITDAAGRTVQRTEFTNTQSLNNVISVATLPAGLYTITLRADAGQHSQSVSIVK